VLRYAFVVLTGRKRAERMEGGVGGRYVVVRSKENGDDIIATTLYSHCMLVLAERAGPSLLVVDLPVTSRSCCSLRELVLV
jgi:hypothetical protein